MKWQKEQHPLTREVPRFEPATYRAPERDDSTNRAFRDQVLAFAAKGGQLVDVRSPQEYSGERLHMPDYPNEGALRGGHIPGARSVPWSRAVNPDDGAFKSADELSKIYIGEQGLRPGDDVMAYCRIGERSAHTWFVLKSCLASRTCATTTEAGPSGATWSTCRLRERSRERHTEMTASQGPERAYPGRLGEILQTLAAAGDANMRSEMLVAFADRFREVPADIARRPFPHLNQIPACESEAYLWGVLQPDGGLRLHFAVENPSGVSAKALAVILDRALSGRSPSEVAQVSPEIVTDVFRANISMGKGLGLMSMVRAVQTIARQATRHLEAGGSLPAVFPRAA